MDVQKLRQLADAARHKQGSLGLRLREGALDTILAGELLAEQSTSLGRVGRRIEAALARAEELRLAHAVAEGEERERLRLEHREVRAAFLTARWELVVQREAMGLRRHSDLDIVYPTPPPLR